MRNSLIFIIFNSMQKSCSWKYECWFILNKINLLHVGSLRSKGFTGLAEVTSAFICINYYWLQKLDLLA